MKLVNKIVKIIYKGVEEESASNNIGYIYEFNEQELEYLKSKGIEESKKYFLASMTISDDMYDKKYTKMLDELISYVDNHRGVYSFHSTIMEAYYYTSFKNMEGKYNALVEYYMQDTKDFIKYAIRGKCNICIESSEGIYPIPVNARDKMGRL